ncbi:MAG: isoleucine--tRNA ligase [Candidatus Moraniibacteriota bacterium]
MFKKVDSRKKYSEMEKEIIQFWKEDGTFRKSVEQRSKDKYYSFYDGPPFITGVPHYGTLLSSIVKDAVPRYWTMKGFRVERRWGWDCHGLPAENMVEKKLGLKSKKDIEKIGVDKFNEACLRETSQIASEWEDVVDRVGRWVEFKGAYKTMDKGYMESVWWAFSELHKKGLIYEDVRVSLYCPRCSTPLSNFEIAMDNSYEMDSDPSAFVKLKIKNQKSKLEEGNNYFLVWTTTPWTLLANVALAIGKDIDYVKVRYADRNGNPEFYILAKSIYEKKVDNFFPSVKEISSSEVPPTPPSIMEEFKGVDLVGMEYEPIFPQEIENGYRVIAGDFVTTEDGSGIVHIAPAFGEDDFQVRKPNNLPIIMNVDEEGQFTEGEWQGQKVWDVNNDIVKWLKVNNFLFKREQITHSYPHCHRCHTKLIYKAQPAWYVNVDKIRQNLLDENEKINWYPEFLKHGRFQNGIESAPDWNISRDRYFGTAIPVWKCSSANSKEEVCGNIKVVGSYEELKELSGVELSDYHRPGVDNITFKCEKCAGVMKRIPQVFDSWIESGSMPFAQFHYPFENKEVFEKSFPTDFISEYIAQTRAWFYVLHVMSVGIFGKISFKNVVTTGTIAGSDGKKMSKSLGNYPDSNIILEKHSADALRFYLLSSPLLNAQNISFSEKAIQDIQRKVLSTLWNSYAFFTLYASVDKWEPKNNLGAAPDSKNLLDRWIVSELHKLIGEVDSNMQGYDLVKATRPFELFVDNLSNWYIRRSRKRFWKSENDDDKNNAYETLHYVLVELAKAMAPFMPFIAEEMYLNLRSGVETSRQGGASVHLAEFPVSDEKLIDDKLNAEMKKVRDVISEGLQQRALNKIKVRQPLASATIKHKIENAELIEIMQEELNVKNVFVDEAQEENIKLNTNITPELKLEGTARELVRAIQEMRKEAGYEVDNHIKIGYAGAEEVFAEHGDLIAKETLANNISAGELAEADLQKEVLIDEVKYVIFIKKDVV